MWRETFPVMEGRVCRLLLSEMLFCLHGSGALLYVADGNGFRVWKRSALAWTPIRGETRRTANGVCRDLVLDQTKRGQGLMY